MSFRASTVRREGCLVGWSAVGSAGLYSSPRTLFVLPELRGDPSFEDVTVEKDRHGTGQDREWTYSNS